MVVEVREGASPEERDAIARILASHAGGYIPTPIHTSRGVVFCLPRGAETPEIEAQIESVPGVERVLPLATTYQLASRAFQPEKTVVQVGEARIGGEEPVIIAGPCSVESEEQILEAARAARAAGAQVLRGGAFKPRTSPYTFQGLGLRGVELLAQAGAAAGLPIVTEVMEPGLVAEVAALSDILQIGSRNMQNYPLLRAVGQSERPVLLKRGFASTLEEWLLAAEYILAEGNPNVILCERGVRSYDPQTRNLLDLTCVPLLSELTHLPVIIDPSHATGKRELVLPMGIAAIGAGADGLIVEMHPRPDEALSDSAQTIDPATLRQLVRRSHLVHAALVADEAEHASAGELVGSEAGG